MVNATSLASFMYCPRKLFISSVLDVKEPIKDALVRGTVWHLTYETINKKEKEIVLSLTSASYPDISDVYRRAFAKFLRNAIIMKKKELHEFCIDMAALFKEYWTHFETEANTRALSVAQFAQRSGLLGSKLWDALTPKIISEMYLKSQRLNLSGIIDMIEVYGEGKDEVYVPVEFKTGKFPAKGMWDGHRIQLAAYLMLLEDAGKNVREGVLLYKDAGDKRILPMNSMLRSEVCAVIEGANDVIMNYVLPARTDNRNKCEKCSFRELCADEGRLSLMVEKAKSVQDGSDFLPS